MRVLVCGGRDYSDFQSVIKTLDKIEFENGISRIIVGGARGADRLARDWSDLREQICLTFPTDWGKHGKSAGFIRNTQMLKEGKPDLVVAFPGGRGTEMMVQMATKAGVPVRIIKDKDSDH